MVFFSDAAEHIFILLCGFFFCVCMCVCVSLWKLEGSKMWFSYWKLFSKMYSKPQISAISSDNGVFPFIDSLQAKLDSFIKWKAVTVFGYFNVQQDLT